MNDHPFTLVPTPPGPLWASRMCRVAEGDYVLTERDYWAEVTYKVTEDGWTTLKYADGSEEEGCAHARILVARKVTP